MRKLLLLPITLPLGMARGAIEGAVKTAAEALMELAPRARGRRRRGAGPRRGARPPASASAAGRRSAAAPAARARRRPRRGRPPPPPPPPPAAVVDLDEARPARVSPSEVAEDLGLEHGHLEEEPDELVESEGAADPGAELHVDEPWPGYGRLRARRGRRPPAGVRRRDEGDRPALRAAAPQAAHGDRRDRVVARRLNLDTAVVRLGRPWTP